MTEQAGLSGFFEKYLAKEPLFVSKKVLQVRYVPDTILHRKAQIDALASILAPSLRNDLPSNVFLYGKTGTGKTVVTKHVLAELEVASKRVSANKDVNDEIRASKCADGESENRTGADAGADEDSKLKIIYLNCKLKKVADTEYRLVAQLSREIGASVPATGLPTDEVYNIFLKAVDCKEQLVIIALDEIDRLVSKAGDELLYNLTRFNSELKKAQISIIGITNDVRFIENVDARVRSSLGEEEMVFPPYNAVELKEILEARAKLAFKESACADGVIAKCAAYAAREHGDARRALDLLRVAGELAERENVEIIDMQHIDAAEEKIEKSRIIEVVEKQPKQSQAALFAIIALMQDGDLKKVETGEVYERYVELCPSVGLTALTQRRVSDLLAELDMLGVINAQVISKGRYGRTKEIYLSLSKQIIEKIKDMLSKSLV